jgi:hypothetical protein
MVRRGLSKEERILESMGMILSRLPESELKELFNENNLNIDMPNDQNYTWSEEDKEQDSKIFDFNKIKPVKFSDPLIKKLQPKSISDYFLYHDIGEANLESEYATAFLIYKYSQIHKKIPTWIYLTSDVLKKDFFDKFIGEMKLPADCFIATYNYNNKKTQLGNLWCNFDKVFIYYDGNGFYIIYPPEMRNEKEDNELSIILGLAKMYKSPQVIKNKIYIVYRGQYGFEKKDFTLKRIKNINIGQNYNDDFEKVSHDIISKLNNKKKTGLVILHGEPGTGKCVVGNTKIIVRNKKTGEIKRINIADLM